jgi:hypothetical protein
MEAHSGSPAPQRNSRPRTVRPSDIFDGTEPFEHLSTFHYRLFLRAWVNPMQDLLEEEEDNAGPALSNYDVLVAQGEAMAEPEAGSVIDLVQWLLQKEMAELSLERQAIKLGPPTPLNVSRASDGTLQTEEVREDQRGDFFSRENAARIDRSLESVADAQIELGLLRKAFDYVSSSSRYSVRKIDLALDRLKSTPAVFRLVADVLQQICAPRYGIKTDDELLVVGELKEHAGYFESGRTDMLFAEPDETPYPPLAPEVDRLKAILLSPPCL